MTIAPDTPAPRIGQLTRDDWIAAARAVLIARGISAVGVRALAAAMQVTSGAFYWQFRNLEDLHQALRTDWAERNTAPFTRAIAAAGPEGLRQYLAWVRVLVTEEEFDPDHDNAIRDWAHGSPATAEVLARVESFRIAQLCGVFRALGFDGHRAQIRARVAYYHQVGYNALRVREPRAQRLLNVPYYAEILTDSQALAHLDSPESIRCVLEGGPIPPV
jgi:AcrR family transcriptional regulator